MGEGVMLVEMLMTGSSDYRARYYDPTIGRFLSEDPIEFYGSGSNFYGYVGNNSPDYTDPLGLCPNKDSKDYCILQVSLWHLREQMRITNEMNIAQLEIVAPGTAVQYVGKKVALPAWVELYILLHDTGELWEVTQKYRLELKNLDAEFYRRLAECN